MWETCLSSFAVAVLMLFGFGEKYPSPSAIISDSGNSLKLEVLARRHVLMEMISKLGSLARACFFLSLACARLALRLAHQLCACPRPAFSASPFAFSASRKSSPQTDGLSTKHGSAATSCAPALAQVLGASPSGCQGRGGRPSPQAAWEGSAVSHPQPPPDYNFCWLKLLCALSRLVGMNFVVL